MRYRSLFNITEISAVLESFPPRERAYIWFKNFYSPIPAFDSFIITHGWF
jgi:hypothetical protein